MFESWLVKFCDLKRAAVVLEVTSGAVGLSPRNVERASVISVFLLNPLGDIGMALQAFEAALSESEVVARGAFGGAFQILVSLGQRPGRDLGVDRAGQQQDGPGQ